MSNLKQCPFCGGEAQIAEQPSDDGRTEYWGECLDEYCRAGWTGVSGNKSRAIVKWNTRHGEPNPSDIDALMKESDAFKLGEGAILSLMKTIGRHKEALQKYGFHLPMCNMREQHVRPENAKCTCGFEKALNQKGNNEKE